MQHGVFLPPFNEFAHPARVVALSVRAEERGWDGLYLWDHVLRREDQAAEVADPWVVLAAVAVATERIRLGPMVTPLARRRPQVVARQAVTLDHLSGGRLTLGLGLGVDSTGELSRFGEVVDPLERGDLLDEGVELLAQLLSGQRVEHRGRWFVAEGVTFLPVPSQQPRCPLWLAARGGLGGGSAGHASGRALRRAARYDGLFLIDAGPRELELAIGVIRAERGSLDGFDIAVEAHPGMPLDVAESLGATWSMLPIRPETAAAEVEALVEAGPPGRS